MPVPQYANAIYSFLTSKGLSPNAAAGILGNIEQESGGNPESVGSGGGGLIGFTPLPAGTVTGSPAIDISRQLDMVLAYIKANGSVSDINAHASSPQAAASYFMSQYERPLASAANEQNRVQSAIDVANAAKKGKWSPSTSNTSPANPSAPSGGIGIPGLSEVIPFFSDATKFVNSLMWLLKPSNWIRIVAFVAGVALLLFAIHAFIATGNGEPIVSVPRTIPVPV